MEPSDNSYYERIDKAEEYYSAIENEIEQLVDEIDDNALFEFILDEFGGFVYRTVYEQVLAELKLNYKIKLVKK